MSNHRGEVVIDWADGTHTFRLTILTGAELEEKCDAAVSVIARRLMTGQWTISDVRETIRLGLIGAGMKPAEALRLVRTYVDDVARYPLAESAMLANVIVGGMLHGFAASPLATGEGSETQPPPGSTSPPSMPPPVFSGLEDLLETSRSGNGMPS